MLFPGYRQYVNELCLWFSSSSRSYGRLWAVVFLANTLTSSAPSLSSWGAADRLDGKQVAGQPGCSGGWTTLRRKAEDLKRVWRDRCVYREPVAINCNIRTVEKNTTIATRWVNRLSHAERMQTTKPTHQRWRKASGIHNNTVKFRPENQNGELKDSKTLWRSERTEEKVWWYLSIIAALNFLLMF